MIILLFILAALYTPPKEPKISPLLTKWLAKGNDEKTIKVWVFFTDKRILTKSELEQALQEAENKLSPRARRRRLRVKHQGELCDFSDLPVSEDYVQTIEELGGKRKVVSRWLNGATFIVKGATIYEIENLPWVREIDMVRILRSKVEKEAVKGEGISYGNSERQLELVGITEAHRKGYSGKGVLIGLMDTGCEWRMYNDIRIAALENTHVVAERDFVGNDDFVGWEEQKDTVIWMGDTCFYDEEELEVWHGTAMLSLLAAKMTGKFVGAAFGASFALAKTEIYCNPCNPFQCPGSDIMAEEDNWIAGAEWFDSIGVEIISNSLGYKDWGYPDSMFAYSFIENTRICSVASLLYTKGILLVTAMGNESGTNSPDTCIVAPAAADSILAVGGVDTLGNWQRVTITNLGSVIGPRADSVIKPEVCGPWLGYQVSTISENLEGWGGGTSVATAIVAGACALVQQAYPDSGPMFIRRVIMQTASQASSPDDTLGYGIVNAWEAINYGNPDVVPTPYDRDRLTTPYPSPFRLGDGKPLYIAYQLVNNTVVTLRIYTLSGRLIWERGATEEIMGPHTLTWDGKISKGEAKGRLVSSGTYLCTLQTGYGKDIKKFAVIR